MASTSEPCTTSSRASELPNRPSPTTTTREPGCLGALLNGVLANDGSLIR